MANRRKRTPEERAIIDAAIIKHLPDDGPDAVAKMTGQPKGYITSRAQTLGVKASAARLKRVRKTGSKVALEARWRGKDERAPKLDRSIGPGWGIL